MTQSLSVAVMFFGAALFAVGLILGLNNGVLLSAEHGPQGACEKLAVSLLPCDKVGEMSEAQGGKDD